MGFPEPGSGQAVAKEASAAKVTSAVWPTDAILTHSVHTVQVLYYS